MRESCDDCRTELRVADSFIAEEGARELEIVVWSCPTCGTRAETVTPLPGEAPEPAASLT